MSCACENKKIASDLDHIRALAKAFATAEQETIALFQNEDGTYGFCPINETIDKPIIEYITEY